MPHTITVVIEAPDDEPTRPVIRSVLFAASNGNGVTAEDILTLQAVGLRIPGLIALPEAVMDVDADTDADFTPLVAPVRELSPSKASKRAPAQRTSSTPIPAKKAPSKQAPAKKAAPVKKAAANVPAKKAPAKKAPSEKRPYHRAPQNEVLVFDYKRLGGSTSRLAEEHGVPVHTAQTWINRLRRNGLIAPA